MKTANGNIINLNISLLITLSTILFSFTVADSRSEYEIPKGSNSIFTCDLDLDKNLDIVIGTNMYPPTNWGGGIFSINNGTGNFQIFDSIYFDPAYPTVNGNYIDNNDYMDIFSITISNDPYTIYITTIYNYGLSHFDSIKSFPIYNNSPIPDISSGDLNGDGVADLLFAHNIDFIWGIIYNDGTGNFSEPEYFDLDFPPVDINCTDLNNDGRSDVVICGSRTEIYFSTESGFEQQVLSTTLSHDVLFSDFDLDGDQDIITHSTFVDNHHRVYMFENLGNKNFIEQPYFEFSPFCQFAQISDLNNDSLPDILFIGHDGEGIYIYDNSGKFQLQFNQYIPVESEANAFRLSCADFDNNKFNDIALIKSYYNTNPSILQILFNDGEGNFQEDPIIDIKELYSKQNELSPISCSPNPFSETTTISINSDTEKKITLEIFNLQGQLIKKLIDKNNPGVNEFILSGNDLNKPGIYLVHLKSGRNIYSKRIVFLK